MKKWFTLAGLLIIIGALIVGLTACSVFDKNLTKSALDVTDDFSAINIDTVMADISILPSSDGVCRVVSRDLEKIKYTAKVEGDTLRIEANDTRMWFEKLFNAHTPTLCVYLPKNEYGALTINEHTGNITVNHGFTFVGMNITLSTGNVSLTNVRSVGDVCVKLTTGDVLIDTMSCTSFTSEGSTGNIEVHGLIASGNVSLERSTGYINIKNSTIDGNLDTETGTGRNNATDVICKGNFSHEVSTGKATLNNVTCRSFTSEGNTGDLTMTGVIASGDFDIERSTGDVKFDGCDAAEIYVETNTGDVTGTLLSDKIFFVETDTGKVRVPESTVGGKCKITTDTGDVKISIDK